jgi:hypothetical protein
MQESGASNQLLLELAARYHVAGVLDVDPLRSPVALASGTAFLSGPTIAALPTTGGLGVDDSGSDSAVDPNLSGTISDFSESVNDSSSAAGDESSAQNTPALRASQRKGKGAGTGNNRSNLLSPPITTGLSASNTAASTTGTTGATTTTSGDQKDTPSATAATAGASGGGFSLARGKLGRRTKRKSLYHCWHANLHDRDRVLIVVGSLYV